MNAPDLLINSEEYSFAPFQFSYDEMIAKETFIFPFDIIIGKQAEFCFAYYLRHSQRYKLIASNIQINGKTETIGEIDYIVYDSKTHRTLHVELACKFYLFDSNLNGCEFSKWIGPNRKDNLKQKLDKLKVKQFPLIHRKETQDTLKELQINLNAVKQQLCLKAFLFLRKGSRSKDFSENFQKCFVGYWLPFIEFINEDKTALYAIPKKKEWLLPVDHLQKWNSFNNIQTLIKEEIEINKSVLAFKKTGAEIVRFIVVWW